MCYIFKNNDVAYILHFFVINEAQQQVGNANTRFYDTLLLILQKKS